MHKKNTLSIIIPIVLILAAFAVSWRSVSAAYKDEKSVFFGKQGIFMPAGLNGQSFILTKVSPAEYRGSPVEFKRSLLDLEFRNSNGKVNIPTSMTYIIYTLNNSEIKQLDKGELFIFYKDVLSGAWHICPTTTVGGTLNNEITTNLTCVAPQSTVYGLGRVK